MFETPILLIIFNRPNTTRRVFEVIRQQKPRYLFVAADGPRHDRHDDIEKCRAAREVIKIDWDCELKTLFRDENRGCGYGPAEAITWFFDNVEQGIILEDDVLPHASFFLFCEELLLRFKYDQRIAMISGINFLNRWINNKSSYFFSYTGTTPGWASWSKVWKNFDYNLKEWNTSEGMGKMKGIIKNSVAFKFYSELFTELSLHPKNDVWDYQWLYTRMNYGVSIIPSVNLISYIGFGDDATHTIVTDDLLSKMVLNEMRFPLIHGKVGNNRFFDWYVFERFINPKKKSTFKRVLLFIIKLVVDKR